MKEVKRREQVWSVVSNLLLVALGLVIVFAVMMILGDIIVMEKP